MGDIAYALAAALREIALRRAAERAERRAKITLVKGGRAKENKA